MTDTPPQIISIDAKPSRLIRMKKVLEMTGLGKTSVYDLLNAGNFPKSVPISERSVAWVEAEVQQWIDDRIAARDAS